MRKIAVLGAGKIGEALLSGLRASGWTPDELTFTERYPKRCAELTERYGIEATDVATAAREADTLVVAVKPQDLDTLLDELAPALSGLGQPRLVVSMCAGIPTATFAARLPEATALVRVMPNTPMLVGEGMCAVSAGGNVTETQLTAVEEMLGSVGAVVRVPEHQQDAVTALSGSGPAYFFYLIESMIEAGVLLGVPRDTARQLIVQAAVGSTKMLAEGTDHPTLLREAVSSPGGTTVAAIRELERHGVRAALIDAIEAAHDRSVELGS